MEAAEILGDIDACQGALPFLANDGRMHLADTRLTVFRSEQDWAIFVEIPHYCEGSEDFHNWVGSAGTGLIEDDGTWSDEVNGRPLLEAAQIEEAQDAPLWKYGVGNEPWKTWVADRSGFSIIFKGERRDFTPTEADYAAAGITFSDQQTGPGSIEPGYLLRFLCHHLNHPFFVSEEELRASLHSSPDLKLFIQTLHWQHPVFLMDSWREDPFFEEHHIVRLPGFQILSRAIASGDLTEWNSQDPAAFTTYWKNLEAIRRENL
jgi:hypothetical protein